MTIRKSRVIQTWYEDKLGAEHDIAVEVRDDGPRDIEIETDLSDLSMDPDEWESLRARVAVRFWRLEHEAYARSAQGERDGL